MVFTRDGEAYDLTSHVVFDVVVLVYFYICVFFVCQDPLSIIMDHCGGASETMRCGPVAVTKRCGIRSMISWNLLASHPTPPPPAMYLSPEIGPQSRGLYWPLVDQPWRHCPDWHPWFFKGKRVVCWIWINCLVHFLRRWAPDPVVNGVIYIYHPYKWPKRFMAKISGFLGVISPQVYVVFGAHFVSQWLTLGTTMAFEYRGWPPRWCLVLNGVRCVFSWISLEAFNYIIQISPKGD